MIRNHFIGNKINFSLYFNPNTINNLYNLVFERLSKTYTFEYKLENISFDRTVDEIIENISFR